MSSQVDTNMCDLCSMLYILGSGFTFSFEMVQNIRRLDGMIVQVRKMGHLDMCPTCHDVLHACDVEALYYRQRVMLKVLCGVQLTPDYCARVHEHCTKLINDFGGGEYCTHD